MILQTPHFVDPFIPWTQSPLHPTNPHTLTTPRTPSFIDICYPLHLTLPLASKITLIALALITPRHLYVDPTDRNPKILELPYQSHPLADFYMLYIVFKFDSMDNEAKTKLYPFQKI